MRSLRILQVTPYYDQAWAYGGIPRVVSAVARNLADRGHRVTVCTTDARDDRTRVGKTGRSAQDVECRMFPNLSNRAAYHLQLFLPRGMGDYLARSAASFDVAHLHGCRNLPVVLAARALRAARTPYLVTPNGTADRIERRRIAKRVFDLIVAPRFLERAPRVQAVTEAERGELEALGVEPGRVRVVGNPVDLDAFDRLPERGRVRARLGLAEAPVVLYLGRFSPRKRLDVLVSAFDHLDTPGAHLILAGSDMGVERRLRSRIWRAGLQERVHWMGLLEGSERLEALIDADVVAYPGEREIFGLVPLEAMLCGRPVMVADDSGCGEVVGRLGGGRIVAVGDAGALAAACDALLNSPPSAADSRAVAERVRESFAAEAIGAQLEQVYHELIGGSDRGHGR